MSRLASLAVASAALLGATAANAVPVYQAAAFGPAPAVFNAGPLTFQGFDTALGVLTSVEFNINDGRSTYSGSVTNNGAAPVNDTLAVRTLLTIAAAPTGTPAALTGLAYATPIVNVAFNNLGAGATQSFGPIVQADPNNNATYFLPASSLSQFTGVPFSFFVTGSSPSAFTSGGSETSSLFVTAQGLISLEYDYTPFATPTSPVPEPASLTLLGLGMLGASLLRRRPH